MKVLLLFDNEEKDGGALCKRLKDNTRAESHKLTPVVYVLFVCEIESFFLSSPWKTTSDGFLYILGLISL